MIILVFLAELVLVIVLGLIWVYLTEKQSNRELARDGLWGLRTDLQIWITREDEPEEDKQLWIQLLRETNEKLGLDKNMVDHVALEGLL